MSLASKTLNSTSLGIVPKAATKGLPATFFASTSAPDEVWATTRPVSFAFIGNEQLTMAFPERSPAWSNTSSTRDQ